MAQQQNIQIRIDAAVQSAEAAQSLGQLRRSLLEIQRIQGEIGDESGPEFQRLQAAASSTTSRLAGTREAIGDIQDRVRTLDGSPIERMRNSFNLLQESIFNLDIDKFKIAMEGLGKSLLTNPIFLIGAAIAAAAVAITAILASLGLLQPLLDGIGKLFKAVGDEVKRFTDFLGITNHAEKELVKTIMDAYEQRKKAIEEEAKLRKSIFELSKSLSEAELVELEKTIGVRLQGIQTIEQAEYRSARSRYDANSAAIQELEKVKRQAEYKGRQLDEETSNKLRELWAQDRILWDELQISKANAAARANEEIIGLENELRAIQAANITDERTRRINQINFERDQRLKELDEKVAIIKSEGKVFEEEAQLRAAINRNAQLQIIEVNKKVRQDDIKERQRQMEEEYQLALLLAKDDAAKRLEVEKKYRDDRLEFMKEYRVELGLSLTQIKIAEQTNANDILNLKKKMYTDDLDEFEKTWKARIDREEEGSAKRLLLEKQFLEEKLQLYTDNQEALGISDEQFATFQVNSQRQLAKITAELTKDFNFDVGVLITRSNLERQMNLLADQLGSPDALEPWNKYVKEIARVVTMEDPITELENIFRNSEDAIEGFTGFARENSEITLKMMRDIAQEYFRQEQSAQALSINNLRIYTAAAKADMESTMRTISETFAFDQLREDTDAYFNKLMDLQQRSYQQQVDLTQQQYVDYVSKQIAQFEAAVKEVEQDHILRKQMATILGGDLATLEEEKEARLLSIREAFNISRQQQEQINFDALAALKVDHETKMNQIEQAASDERIRIRQREENEKLDLGRRGLQGIQALSNLFFNMQKKTGEKVSKEEETRLRQQFEANKLFNAGLAVINGIQSILAITSTAVDPTGITTAIRIAAQVALNAASLAGILGQGYNGPFAGKDLPDPATTTGGGGSTPAIPPMPTFNPASFIGLGSNQMLGPGMVQNPNRVYVVESDITMTQRRVSVIEERAKLT